MATRHSPGPAGTAARPTIACAQTRADRERPGRRKQGRDGCVQNRGDTYAESPRRPGSAAYAAYAAAPGIGRIRKRAPPHGRPDRDDSYVAMGGVRADLVACERPQQSEEDGKAGPGRRALQLRLAILSLEPPRNSGLPGFGGLIGVLGGLEAAGDGLGCRFVSLRGVWRCRGVLCGRIRTAVIGGGRRGGVGRRVWCPGAGAPGGQLSAGSVRIQVSAAWKSVCQGQRAGRCSVQRRLW
jgi:hypothetical protein